MKNKKGFTLIELLAVIVLLSIIMVIAIPQIINIIDSSRRSSQDSSKKILKDAIKTQVMADNINNPKKFNKETTEDGECYKFDFSNKNTNYQNLSVENKDRFTGYTNYCDDGFHDHNLGFIDGDSQITTPIEINSTNILTVTPTSDYKWSVIQGNVINTGIWQTTPTNFYYKDKIVVTAKKPATVTGKVSLWNNKVEEGTNAKMRIGFSTNNTDNENSFTSYTDLDQNFRNYNYDLPASQYTQHEQSFSVTITEPGEYYIKGVYYMTHRSYSAYARVYDLSLTQ